MKLNYMSQNLNHNGQELIRQQMNREEKRLDRLTKTRKSINRLTETRKSVPVLLQAQSQSLNIFSPLDQNRRNNDYYKNTFENTYSL